MGAIISLTSRKKPFFETVLNWAEEINQARFEGKLKIEKTFETGIKVSFNFSEDHFEGGFFDLWWSPRKLEGKLPHDNWLVFVFWTIINEIGVMVNGTLSSDCHDETWKPKSGKYLNFKDYVEKGICVRERMTKDQFETRVKEEMELWCPKGMEKF